MQGRQSRLFLYAILAFAFQAVPWLFKEGELRVLAFLVGKVWVWYGIREDLLWLCGYIEKAGGASGGRPPSYNQ